MELWSTAGHTRRAHRRLAVGGVAALVLGCLSGCTHGRPGQAAAPPTRTRTSAPSTRAAGRYNVYVADQETDSITPVNTATGSAGPPIQLGLACRAPGDLVVDPSGNKAFVQCAGSLIEPVDLATGEVGPPITLSMSGNNDLVFAPDGSKLYALSLNNRHNAGVVTEINTATDVPGKPIPVTGNVTRLALTPDGRHLYVLDYGSGGGQTGSVTDIDTTRGTASAPIPLGENPSAIVITPDSRKVFIACSDSGFVVPLDAVSDKTGQPIPVTGNPVSLVITPNGKTVYAMGANAQTASGSAVTPISTATDSIGNPIDISGNEMTIAPNGGQVYLYGSATSDSVNWFDTASNRAGPPITVGMYPSGISFSADGKKAFILRDGTGTTDPTTKVVPLQLPATLIGKPVTVLPGPGLLAVADRTAN